MWSIIITFFVQLRDVVAKFSLTFLLLVLSIAAWKLALLIIILHVSTGLYLIVWIIYLLQKKTSW